MSEWGSLSKDWRLESGSPTASCSLIPAPPSPAAAARQAIARTFRLPAGAGPGAAGRPLWLRAGVHCGPIAGAVIGAHRYGQF